MAELRDLAASLGVGDTTGMRKGALVDAINERYDTVEADEREGGAAAPDAVEQDTEQQDTEQQAAEQHEAEPAAAQPEAAEQDEPGAPAEPQPEAPAEPAPVETPAEPAATAEDGAASDAGASQPAAEQEPERPEQESDAVSPDEAAGGAEIGDEAAEQRGSGAPKAAADHVNAGLTGIAEDLQELQRRDGGEGESEGDEGERQSGGRRGRGRGRGRGNQQQQKDAQQEQSGQRGQQQQQQKAEQPEQQRGGDQRGGDQRGGAEQQQEGEGRRGRYRDRKRRGSGGEWDEPEVRDDDVLIPIAGILDVLDNYAFVRTSGYLSGANDVYVSLGQVKKYHLRRGDAVVGSIRQIPEQEQPSRQKYNALVKVDSINGLPVAESEGRVDFAQLTPLFPQERLRLETESQKISTRVVDLVAPIGKGQRGLVVAPPRSGRTLLLQAIANAVTTNNPEAHLMVVLVDERPEEVTEMQRTVKGEVIASTFDRPAEDHTTVAELAIDRAKRLVELGYDVVVLLDSISRLARAYAQTVPAAGRQLGGGLDAAALLPAKQLFGAARNVENGGSLTVLATALTETGEADEVVLAEFRGAANSELVLSSALAEKRIFPAVDVSASGTVRDEQLLGPDEVKVTRQLRRALAGREPQEALETVVSKLRETASNVEFLVQMQKSLPSGK
ncbi:transcription termination factor Rho [Amnibacterium endophyticum]|uniref:Transcription termination factor Rho n=1 Tax=Amnibacterium endophyticum TaxID=2109337 RepID=A0ABW4LDR0_9MICO